MTNNENVYPYRKLTNPDRLPDKMTAKEASPEQVDFFCYRNRGTEIVCRAIRVQYPFNQNSNNSLLPSDLGLLLRLEPSYCIYSSRI